MPWYEAQEDDYNVIARAWAFPHTPTHSRSHVDHYVRVDNHRKPMLTDVRIVSRTNGVVCLNGETCWPYPAIARLAITYTHLSVRIGLGPQVGDADTVSTTITYLDEYQKSLAADEPELDPETIILSYDVKVAT